MTKQSNILCSHISSTKNDYCFVLQPKADHQGSKIPFRDYRWVGPFIVQKVLPNENYIVRRINTNKTQILHRIRLKKFVPNQPLEDNFREQRLQPDEEIVIPQDNLYIITWETRTRSYSDYLAEWRTAECGRTDS